MLFPTRAESTLNFLEVYHTHTHVSTEPHQETQDWTISLIWRTSTDIIIECPVMEKHGWLGEGFVYALKWNSTSRNFLLDFLTGPVDKTLVLPRQEVQVWSLVRELSSVAKNLPAMQEQQEIQVQSLGQEDPLEEVFLPEESPWTQELGRQQSIGSQRVGQDWSDLACTLNSFQMVPYGSIGTPQGPPECLQNSMPPLPFSTSFSNQINTTSVHFWNGLLYVRLMKKSFLYLN